MDTLHFTWLIKIYDKYHYEMHSKKIILKFEKQQFSDHNDLEKARVTTPTPLLNPLMRNSWISLTNGGSYTSYHYPVYFLYISRASIGPAVIPPVWPPLHCPKPPYIRIFGSIWRHRERRKLNPVVWFGMIDDVIAINYLVNNECRHLKRSVNVL